MSRNKKTITFTFQVVEDKNCPLYEMGECFRLTPTTFLPPAGKETCLILVREMTQLLFVDIDELPTVVSADGSTVLTCGGCTGLVKFQPISEWDEELIDKREVRIDPERQALLAKIIDCPLFRAVPPGDLQEMLDYFREETVESGRAILVKGEPSQELYVIVSGELSVTDGPVIIGRLQSGEVCGEMSYLSGSDAVASVTAVTETRIVAIPGAYFGTIAERAPELQLYLARLMAKRLTHLNRARQEHLDAVMHGRFGELVPAELFQFLHMHKKTGVLRLTLAGEEAAVSFREGEIVAARTGALRSEEAVFAILTNDEGAYSFHSGLPDDLTEVAEIGDFMSLLMEGVKRADEHGID